MVNRINISKWLHYLLYVFYFIFFVSIVCSFRAVSTIVIILILVTGLLKNKIDTDLFFNKNLKNIFLVSCCVFYLIQAASLFYTHNLPETIKHLQLKSALVLIPLAVCCSHWLNPLIYQRLMKYYTW